MKKNPFIFVLSVLFISFASGVRAEGGHEHENAFVETLEIHHAHIENEFRVNGTFRENVREETVDEAGETVTAYRDVLEHEFELGWGDEAGRIGVEAHLPFTNEGRDEEGHAEYGLGDIEIEPVRYAFVNEPERVWTASLGIVLPTGDEEKGSGEGRTFVEPHLLVDQAWGSWYFGANLVPGFELDGEHETTLGWGVAAAHTWEQVLNGCDVAGSVEVAGESSLSADEEGADVIHIVPGIHIHLSNQWRLRFGLRLPLTEDREEERAFLFQAGTHWGRD